MNINTFDEFVKECKAMEFNEGWQRLWTKVFSLDKLIVAIQKPATEQEEKEPLLFIGAINEEPCVFVFTDIGHYKDFQKRVIEDGDKPEVEDKEMTIQEFLSFTQQLSAQNLRYVIINFRNEFGFHTETGSVVSMYNAFVHGDFLQEEHTPQGTMIQVAIPEEIEEMKTALNQVKGNYRTVINSVTPLLVKIGERVDLIFVMNFKGGLPNSMKKKVMENIHKELFVYPVFQTQLHFTEDLNIVPPNVQPMIQVTF